jgi:hypothetical protein
MSLVARAFPGVIVSGMRLLKSPGTSGKELFQLF